MAKTVCKLLGVVFVIVGVAGFVAPTLLGAHLTPAHNLVHLVSGAIALYFGFAGSYGAAKVSVSFLESSICCLAFAAGSWETPKRCSMSATCSRWAKSTTSFTFCWA
jgi:hypothetical protein